MEIQEIRLFSSDKSVHAIKNPVKIEIFNLIEQGDCSFDAIVAATGKAKSTISAHIKELEIRGLIFSHPDPADFRKRIISKSAISIGTLTNQDRNFQGRLQIPTDITQLQTADLFRIILMTLRMEVLSLGINVDPLLKRVGSQIGTYLAPSFIKSTLEETLTAVAQFWHEHKLGKMVVNGLDPIILEITDCFECSEYPITGKPECHFAMGFVTILFAHYYEKEVPVTETTCYAAADTKCMFEIIPPTQEEESQI